MLDYHKTCLPAYASDVSGGWMDDVMQHMPYKKALENGKMCKSMVAGHALAGEYFASCTTIGIEKGTRDCTPFLGRNPQFIVDSTSVPGGSIECGCSLSGKNEGAWVLPPQ